MKKVLETLWEQFPHLGEMPPEIGALVRLYPGDVHNEQLLSLDEHLKWLCERFPKICNEISKVRDEIKLVIWNKVDIRNEVMQAANNPYYYKEQEVA